MTDSSPSVTFSGAPEQFVTTPDKLQHHMISEGELERLTEMKRDYIIEIFFVSVGTLLGALAPAIDGLIRFNAEVNPMGILGLVQLIICAAALSASAITGFLWFKRARRSVTLVEEIRNRTSKNMTPA